MLSKIQNSILITENIAKQLGVDCSLLTLYIDNSKQLAKKIKTALSMVPTSSYIVDFAYKKQKIERLLSEQSYDFLLLNETTKQNFESVIEFFNCPLIIVPEHFYKLNNWKLAYTLDDVINKTLYNASCSYSPTQVKHFSTTLNS